MIRQDLLCKIQLAQGCKIPLGICDLPPYVIIYKILSFIEYELKEYPLLTSLKKYCVKKVIKEIKYINTKNKQKIQLYTHIMKLISKMNKLKD